MYADSYPADFKFKEASDTKRTSFVEQFRDYEEKKQNNEQEGEFALEKRSQQNIKDVESDQGHRDMKENIMERLKQLIAQISAYFSEKNN